MGGTGLPGGWRGMGQAGSTLFCAEAGKVPPESFRSWRMTTILRGNPSESTASGRSLDPKMRGTGPTAH